MINILPKKVLACVVFGSFLVGLLYIMPKHAYAVSAASDVQLSYGLNISLRSDYSAQLHWDIALKNTSPAKLVSSYELKLPFTKISNPRATLNKTRIKISVSSGSAGTVIVFQFGDLAVRKNQKVKLTLDFEAVNVVKYVHGLLQMYIPPLQSNYTTNDFALHLSYPGAFPPLVYASETNSSNVVNTVDLRSKSGFWLVWGKELVLDIKNNVEVAKAPDTSLKLVNLPPRLSTQEVVFQGVGNLHNVAIGRGGSTWAILSPADPAELTYQAKISRSNDSSTKLSDLIPSITIPEVLQNLIADKSEDEKLKFLYHYVSDSLKPSHSLDLTRFDPQQVDINQLREQGASSSLQFSYLLAGYLKSLGMPVQVAYGYLMAPDSLENLDVSQPLAWVETVLDGQLRVIDPYLTAATGLDTFNSTYLTRLTMGVWDPEFVGDAALGLTTGSIYPRPVEEDVGQVSHEVGFTASAVVPAPILTPGYFDINVLVTNPSGYVLKLSEVTLDGVDVNDHSIQLSKYLTWAAPPLGSSTLTLTSLPSTQFLQTGSQVGRILLKPELEIFKQQSVPYKGELSPNWGLILQVVGIISVLVLLVIIVIMRQRLRLMWMTRRYLRKM